MLILSLLPSLRVALRRVMRALCLVLTLTTAFTGLRVPGAHGQARPGGAPRHLTVDDVLRMEHLGRAELALNGRLVVYEWVAPYREAPNLEAVSVLGVSGPMSKLYVVDLARQDVPRPLLKQEPRGGYWIGALSPSGTKVAVYSVTDSKLRAGVFDLARQRLIWFDFTPNYFWLTQHPVWISDEELVYPALPPSEIPSGFRSAVVAHYNELWKKAFGGREPSATVFKSSSSGIDQAEVYRPGKLVRVHARTGKTAVLDEGYFYKPRLSPDGRYLAALKQGGRIQPTPSRFWVPEHHQLVIYDLTSRNKRLVPCEDCSLANHGLLQWSADGRRLAFAARRLHSNIENEELLQYWPATGTIKPVPNSGLWSSCGVSPIPVGSGEAVAVYSLPLVGHEKASPSSPCPLEGARWDWFLMDAQGVPVNLTASFQSVYVDVLRFNAPLGISGDALFVVADGDVWRLDLNGQKQRLTQGLSGSPEPWILGIPGSGVLSQEVDFLGSPLPTAQAVLQTSDEVLLLDLRSGTLKRLRKPNSDAKLLAISDTAGVFRSDSRTGSSLLVANGQAPARTLLTINGYLSEIAEAGQKQIGYEFEGTRLSSCALLPPNWNPERRYPLVVDLYPFSGPSKPCGSTETHQFSPYNWQLLTARGYIVLFVASPPRLIRTPDSPLGKLATAVLAAIDEAVREGYADPDRIGIYGVSQGHHAVLKVLTQTDRFKAAVVGNGMSNALSHYGSLPLYQRMLPEVFSFGNPDRYELNSGPNGLGAKPWENPMRYVQNSPVLHADKIKAPLLIMHSDLDQFPLEQSEQLFSALYRLRKEAVYVTYWGEPHGLLSPANIRDMWKRMFDWYDKHLDVARDTEGNLVFDGDRVIQ